MHLHGTTSLRTHAPAHPHVGTPVHPYARGHTCALPPVRTRMGLHARETHRLVRFPQDFCVVVFSLFPWLKSDDATRSFSIKRFRAYTTSRLPRRLLADECFPRNGSHTRNIVSEFARTRRNSCAACFRWISPVRVCVPSCAYTCARTRPRNSVTEAASVSSVFPDSCEYTITVQTLFLLKYIVV